MISEAIRLIRRNSRVGMVPLPRRGMVPRERQDQMVQKVNVDLVRRFWELPVVDCWDIRLAMGDSVRLEELLLLI